MRGLGLSLFLVALLLPAAAFADRVVIGPIRGDRNGAIGRRLDHALSERLDVIPWEDFLVGYREVGGTPNADAVRTACRNVRARRLVLGDVNSRRTVHLTALSCHSGEPDVELEVLLYNGLPERAALLDALSMLVPEEGAETEIRRPVRAPSGRTAVEEEPRSPRRGDPEPPLEEEGADVAEAEVTEDGESAETGVEALPPESDLSEDGVQDSAFLASSFDSSRGRSSLGHVADDESPDAELASGAEVTAPGGSPLSSILEASAGFVMATRTLTVPLSTGDSVAYSGGGYTEVGAQVAAFPLAAFIHKPWARMFGLTGAFYQGVFMPVSGANLATSAVDGYVGAIGRLELGTKPIFDIRPSFTWGWWGFAITPNADIATFNYRFLRFGLEARMHLMDRRVSLGVSGGWRMVSDIGEATTTYGNESAGAGWDVGASASIVLAKILELSAGGELVSYDGVYAGVGTLPERQAISSADSYPRGFLRAGVVLR
jgi:hypothetical protein